MAGSGNRTTIDHKVGALGVDPRNNVVQVGGRVGTQDGTATPKVSPQAFSGTTVITLTVPANAIGISLTAELDDILYGDNSTLDATSPADGAGCDLLYEGCTTIIPLAAMASFYIRARVGGLGGLAFFHWIYAGSAS